MRETTRSSDAPVAVPGKAPAPNQAALDLLDRINKSNPAGSSAPAGTTDPNTPKLQSWVPSASPAGGQPEPIVGLQAAEPRVAEQVKQADEVKQRSKGTLPPDVADRIKTLTPMPQQPDSISYTPTSFAMGMPVNPGSVVRTPAPEPEAPRKSIEMTWDRYNSLTDTQRDAVDFNTLLVRAREKDLNADYEPKARQSQQYYADLEDMFGKDGGSYTYAPETLAVLKQIGWQPEKLKVNAVETMKGVFDGQPDAPKKPVMGADFDDFLSLDAAITGKQLRSATYKQIDDSTGVITPLSDLEPVQKALLDHTADLQEQMAKSGEFLQSFAAGAANMRSKLTEGYGGTENKVRVDIGYGGGDPDNEYRAIFDLYADKDFETKTGKALSDGLVTLREGLQMEGKLESFLRYAENRSAQAKEYGLPLGTTERVSFRSPEEFREMLGFDEKKG